MATSGSEMEKNLASLVELTDSILKGDFARQGQIEIDSESLISNLASKINAMVVNLRNVEAPLSKAGNAAPVLVNSANDVVGLMSQSTEVVLNKSDKLLDLADRLNGILDQAAGTCPEFADAARDIIISLKAASFDIIASQSYQDVGRQKMEAMVRDLNQTRDWLIDALIVLNIRRNGTDENIRQKTKILAQVKNDANSQDLKQDLVDDLLAEFGF
ncbi:MAG: hypothetical protein KKB30_06050 [Proteobacteria bacterium]|nr:hypothetical protein [Pseudomonadota bacterium]MBU1715082.1 hypothetical protein [Pseudomonadota bacterium]